MEEQIVELLKSINDGRTIGAKKKLAKLLNVSETIVGLWFNGKSEPSVDMLAKLSKVFKKPEKELQKIFEIKNNNISNSFNSTDKENELLRKEIELKNKEIELLKKEMELNKRGR